MPDLHQHFDKPVNVAELFQYGPVKPTDLVILTIPIVVSGLSAPNFVPHEQHRRTYRKQGGGEKIFYHAVAQPLDGWIVAGTFNAAVPTQIGTRAVAVILSIGFIVFRVVRDQIVQGEAIMAGYEIDALLGLALGIPVDVRASKQAIPYTLHRIVVRFHEATYIVAESAVPFLPRVADE